MNFHVESTHKQRKCEDKSLDNFNGARTPTILDDETKRYSVSSLWVLVESGQVFMCTSAVKNNAHWVDITNIGGVQTNTVSTLGEGISLYANQSGNDLRFKSITGTESVHVTEQNNTLSLSSPFPSTTSDLIEGDNLYFTDQRVQDNPKVVSLDDKIESLGTLVSSTSLVTTTNLYKLLSHPTQPDTSYLIEIRVLGRKDQESSKSAAYIFNALFVRTDVLTLVTEDKLDLESVNNWDAVLSASGTNICLEVVGDANVNWKLSGKITFV